MATQATHRHAISNILVATDLSPCSATAMRLAGTMARDQHSHLWVAHVAETSTLDFELAQQSSAALQTVQHDMEHFISSSCPDPVPCQVLIEAGDLWNVLSHMVEEHHIDLIVTGTHGRSGLGRALLGSAAELIVHNSNCPVLTVSPQAEASDAMLRIVFPMDLTATTMVALPYAIEIANENNAQLVFVHLLNGAPGAPLDYPDETSTPDEQYAEAMSAMRELLPDDSAFRRSPELIIQADAPADGVLRIAKGLAADLIIMPVRHKTTLTRSRRPWSTVSRILAHAPCPVLTIAG